MVVTVPDSWHDDTGPFRPPVPAFYDRPATVDDIVNHTIGRVLDGPPKRERVQIAE
jgi:hypothetical protein